MSPERIQANQYVSLTIDSLLEGDLGSLEDILEKLEELIKPLEDYCGVKEDDHEKN